MRSRPSTRFVSLALAAALSVTSCASRQAEPSQLLAVDSVMTLYDPNTGLWRSTGWWNSANVMTSMIDYMIQSGETRYLWIVGNTYAKNLSRSFSQFTNDYIDDTGWWVLAWIRAFDLTKDRRYLDTARYGVEFMYSYRDDMCGGGLWWSTHRSYKNAITNELFINAAAQLHNRGLGDGRYLDMALDVWEWFDASGMINDENLVNDGLNSGTCLNNRDTPWTYNQGVILSALTELHVATGDRDYLDRAVELAEASTTDETLNPDGILREPCEDRGCDSNGPSFKGIYVRGLGELNAFLRRRDFHEYLQRQARSAMTLNQTDAGWYGLHWAGPINHINAATQHSAIDLLVAAGPLEPEKLQDLEETEDGTEPVGLQRFSETAATTESTTG